MTRLYRYAGILGQMLFGCGHQRLGWQRADEQGQFRTCLTCGRRIPARVQLTAKIWRVA